MAKYNIYAVKNGRKTGIFESWEECEASVDKFSKAEFRGFKTIHDAEMYMFENAASGPLKSSIIPIGTYNPTTKMYGYGSCLTYGERSLLLSGSGDNKEMCLMRYVAGEALGVTDSIKRAIELGLKHVTVFYDYGGIKKWATGEWQPSDALSKKYAKQMKTLKSQILIEFKHIDECEMFYDEDELIGLANVATGKVIEEKVV